MAYGHNIYSIEKLTWNQTMSYKFTLEAENMSGLLLINFAKEGREYRNAYDYYSKSTLCLLPKFN